MKKTENKKLTKKEKKEKRYEKKVVQKRRDVATRPVFLLCHCCPF